MADEQGQDKHEIAKAASDLAKVETNEAELSEMFGAMDADVFPHLAESSEEAESQDTLEGSEEEEEAAESLEAENAGDDDASEEVEVEGGGDKDDEEEVDEDDSNEVAELKSQFAELKAQNQLLLDLTKGKEQGEPDKPKEPEIDQTPLSFVDEELAEKIFDDRDPAALNKALTMSMRIGQQQLMQALPQMIEKTVRASVQANKTVVDFYSQNSDLTAYADHVSLVAQDIAKKNPSLDVGQLYEKTAKKCRKLFNLPQPGEKSKPPKETAKRKPSGQPAGAGGKSGGTGTPQKKQPEKSVSEIELDEMFS